MVLCVPILKNFRVVYVSMVTMKTDFHFSKIGYPFVCATVKYDLIFLNSAYVRATVKYDLIFLRW